MDFPKRALQLASKAVQSPPSFSLHELAQHAELAAGDASFLFSGGDGGLVDDRGRGADGGRVVGRFSGWTRIHTSANSLQSS
jgi:hypothetical protein